MFGPPRYDAATAALKLPAHLRKTFHWITPSDTHYRIVDCATAAEAGQCRHYEAGFLLPIDVVNKELQKAQLKEAGYRFWEGDAPAQEGYPTGLKVFFFPPGQRCLASRENPHRLSLERPPFLIVQGGDWRGNPRNEKKVHTRIDDWVNDLHSNVDRLNHEIGKG